MLGCLWWLWHTVHSWATGFHVEPPGLWGPDSDFPSTCLLFSLNKESWPYHLLELQFSKGTLCLLRESVDDRRTYGLAYTTPQLSTLLTLFILPPVSLLKSLQLPCPAGLKAFVVTIPVAWTFFHLTIHRQVRHVPLAPFSVQTPLHDVSHCIDRHTFYLEKHVCMWFIAVSQDLDQSETTHRPLIQGHQRNIHRELPSSVSPSLRNLAHAAHIHWVEDQLRTRHSDNNFQT